MNRNNLRVVSIMLLSIILVAMPFIGACAPAPTAPTAPTAPKPEDQPLKVGFPLICSGAAAEKGAPGAYGKLACIRYINEELGGVNGHPIEVHWYDDAYDAAKTISVVKMLMEENCLFFTTSSSKEMEATMEIANRAGFLGMVYCGSTKCVHPPAHIFAMMPMYDDDWVAFAKYYLANIWKGPGKPKMVLCMLNNPVGYAAKAASLAFAEQLGIEIIAEEEHTATTISEMASLTRIRALNPDVLWISSTPAPAAVIIKNAYALGMYPGVTIGVSHAGMVQTLIDLGGAKVVEGVYGTSPIALWGEGVPGEAKMAEYCDRLYPRVLGYTDFEGCWAEGLIVAEVLRLALENCGYEKLAKGGPEAWECVERCGFRNVKNFSPGGIIGPVDFSDDYDLRGSKSLRIVKVVNGEMRSISDWMETEPIHYEEFEWFK